MHMPDERVLIVEDEALIALMLSDMIEGMGLKVCGMTDTASGAMALAEMHKPDLILMDVRLNGAEDGVSAALEIHEKYQTPVVFVTASREQETIDRIMSSHPAGLLIKPILPDQLKAVVQGIFP
jgi:two-component system, response regulator PdtaR